jgi:hypothetical protein
VLDILRQKRLPLPVHHELLRFLEDQVETELDIPSEKICRSLSKRFNGQRVCDVLEYARADVSGR